jgi:glycosyltransferase involved in cell wall biosynthesis
MGERPFRVAVDARCLNVKGLRGMGKALYQFIRRTAASGAIEWHVLADRPDLPMHVPHDDCHVSVFETRGYRFASWEQYSLPAAAKRVHADLLYAPATTGPWWQPVPTVITINDTIPWQSGEWAKPGFYRDRVLPGAYRHAGAIMTISDTSRRDILARWPDLKPKLHVTPLGVDERYLEAVPDEQPLVIDGGVIREPYLLYLGGAEPRKRLMWALEAWWSAAGNATMVVCGLETRAHDRIRNSVPDHVRDRLVIAPYVSEEDMPRLYMRASAVLYPSLYEGFGMPVVEAQAVGTPVLFSDVGSLTELKGPAAVVLTVGDLSAWVRAIEVVLQSSPTGRPDRVARAWARQYSWDAYTTRTLDVYRSVARSGRRSVEINSTALSTNRTTS